MEQFISLISDILIEYGYWGMFIAAFIAGSVFPFSSEAVMAGLQVAGLNPIQLLIWGTTGNIAGSMFNYWIGSMGKMKWIEKYLNIKKEKVEQTQRFMQRGGAWMGIFCFLPIIGSVIAVTMGYMRANLPISIISISIGKFVRYAILVYTISLL